MARKIVYVIQHSHFDPIWRRCWDRTFDYKGKRYRSYADIEELILDIWLDNARRGASFSEGQAVVFRKYIERNPHRLNEIREFVARGIIELTAAGETVADTNMPSGETLLRNLVMGQRYFEEMFGFVPHIGWLEDAFGQSAQMPQLFRGVGCDMVMGLSYARVPGNYWRGLDGSVIFTGGSPFHYGVGSCIKIPPCSECNGVGCEICGFTGLAEAARISDEEIQRAFASDEFLKHQSSHVCIGGEESVPNPHLPKLLEEANRSRTDIEFKFGGFQHVADDFADELAKLDNTDIEISPQVEANPVSTGCYVTRITIKQEFRRIENLLNTAERWATIAYLLGAKFPTEELTHAWRNLIFVAFHDAITSTHIDSAYFELLDMMVDSEIEAESVMEAAFSHIESLIQSNGEEEYLAIYNSESWGRSDPVTVTISGTSGIPALKDSSGQDLQILDVRAEGEDVTVTFQPPEVPPMGYTAVQIETDAEPVHSGEVSSGPGQIENEYFLIRVSERGITSILDKRTGKEILDTGKYLGNELLLEEDIGHPWGTMQIPSFQEPLGQYTTGVNIRRGKKSAGEISIIGQYKGQDPNVRLLTWRQYITLYKGVARIDFRTEIDWDCAQRRIRVVFPTGIKTDAAVYSIPYGAIERSKYQPEMDRMSSTNGDWPAINWVDVYSPSGDWGVALLNTGTPSHKVEDGVIYLSILRSPTDSWCLNEPEYYDCPDFDGARDAGVHEFRYYLIPHVGDYRAANIEKRGREVNNPLIVRHLESGSEGKLGLSHSFMDFQATENLVVTALKKCDRDDSVILRIAETGGIEGRASVSIEGTQPLISLADFLERPIKPMEGNSIIVPPFKIVTLKLPRA